MCSDGLKKTRLLYTFVLSHVSLFVEASSAGAPDIPRCPDHVGSQDRGQVRLLPIEARTPPLSSWVNLWSCELDDLPKHDLVGGWAYPSEKYEFVNGVGIIPYMKWTNKHCLKPPTRYSKSDQIIDHDFAIKKAYYHPIDPHRYGTSTMNISMVISKGTPSDSQRCFLTGGNLIVGLLSCVTMVLVIILYIIVTMVYKWYNYINQFIYWLVVQ